MRRILRFLSALGLLAATVAWSGAAPPSPLSKTGNAATRPLPTRRTTLTIPFRIGKTQNTAQQPVEVQLFVSANQGAAWNHAASVKPDAGKISYQAPRDGEYWFCVRTRDASGNVRPSGGMLPELRVMVDTVPPKLRVDAWRGVDGEITAHWDATDAYLNSASLKVAYRRAASQDPWQDVPINYLLPGDARTSYAENVRWKADSAVEVRVEISDDAGNTAQQVVLAGTPPKSDAESPTTAAPVPPQTGVRESRDFNESRSVTNPAAPSPPQPSASWPSGATGGAPTPPTDLPWHAQTPDRGSPWPVDEPKAAPLTQRPIPRPWDDPAPPPSDAPYSPRSPADVRSAADHLSVHSTSSGTEAAHKMLAAPAGQSAWLLGSSAFELAYQLGSLPADDLRSVEVWGTSDGGRSWRQMATDDDRKSPVLVQVDAEGLYGFRLLLQRRTGPVEFPPASGDAPELWLQVDRTEPWCQLTQADQLAGPRSNELVISWEARDANLAERPITLKYSHRPDGPFQTIAAGLENTGRYVWQMPVNLPTEIYLRLEVRDRADNQGTFTADKPITPQLVRPQGRLREAAPVPSGRTTDQRSQPKMYYFR